MKVLAGLVLSEALREGSPPDLSPWLADDNLLPVSPHVLPSMHFCLCAQISLLYKDTSHTRLETPPSDDFILTNHMYSYPISKYGHSLMFWG